MKLNEDTRVKLPTIQHLKCLGYSYLSLEKCSGMKRKLFLRIYLVKTLVELIHNYINQRLLVGESDK